MTTPVDPIAVAAVVVGLLERLGIANSIGGSIAASFAGEPRSTVDIDVVASLGDGQVEALVAALSPDFYVEEDVVGIVRVQGSKLDLAYLQRQAPVLGVTNLLAQALAQRDDPGQD